MELLIVLIVTAGVIWLLVKATSMQSASNEKQRVEKEEFWRGASYHHYLRDTGIGVFPERRAVMLINGSIEKEYPFEKIRSWIADWQTAGRVVGGGLSAATENLAASRRAGAASGLFVQVADIDHHEWHIKFNTPDETKRWAEILRQYLNEGRQD